MKSIEFIDWAGKLLDIDGPTEVRRGSAPGVVLVPVAQFQAMQARIKELEVEVMGLKSAQVRASASPAISIVERGKEAKPRRVVGEALRFMALCPEETHEVLEQLFGDAANHGVVIKWGRRGPSFRAVRPDSSECTLFYLFPPGSQGREAATAEAYLGNIMDAALQEQARQRFGAEAPFEAQGVSTMVLALNGEGLARAGGVAQVLWDICAQVASGRG